MIQVRIRLLAALALALLVAAGAVRLVAVGRSTASVQPATSGPRVEISFSAGARAEPVTGMVYVAISRDHQSAPVQQTDPEGVPLFSKFVDQMKPGATVTIGAQDRGHPVASLRDIPAG